MEANQPPTTPRVVFMGTPDFAVPTLRRLLEETAVVGVFSQPDRPAGRGRALRSSPVADVARAADVPLFQPKGLRRGPEAEAALRALAELRPDILIVAAYGLILPAAALDAGRHGALNVHASLLPRWRGAAPIQHAIIAGDAETGVTIMAMDEGLDTGPIVAREATAIGARETAGGLLERLAVIGADLLVRTLPEWIAGRLEAVPQDHSAATLAPSLTKADGELEWTLSATELARRVRGLDPWPGAFTYLPDGSRLKVHAASAAPADHPAAAEAAGPVRPGTFIDRGGRPAVVTASGLLVLERVQAAGGRVIDGADFLRGRRDLVGGPQDVVGERQAIVGGRSDDTGAP